MKMFIVYVWMAVANELYKGYVALHCIMPEYQPPGGVKNVK